MAMLVLEIINVSILSRRWIKVMEEKE